MLRKLHPNNDSSKPLATRIVRHRAFRRLAWATSSSRGTEIAVEVADGLTVVENLPPLTAAFEVAVA